MLAVVRKSFEELEHELQTARAGAGEDPRQRLEAVCRAYLDFARTRPERYRTMFGGLWMPALGAGSVTEEELPGLGTECLRLIAEAVGDCASAGLSSSTDPTNDAIALWLGMHGLAHQRLVTRIFPGPDDIDERIIEALARLR